jgi:hypothetical protein
MPLLFAAILMVIIFFMPEGLVGLPKGWAHGRGRSGGRGTDVGSGEEGGL